MGEIRSNGEPMGDGGSPDPSILLNLRTMHDSAIRSYYVYELLSKLLQAQDKSLLERISIPSSIAASIISLFAFIQNPASRDLILLAFSVAIIVITVAPLIQRRLTKKKGLDDVTYLGIYLDEAAKYASEITFAGKFNQSDSTVTDFIEDRKDALKGTLTYLRKKVTTLRGSRKYPPCLEEIGRSENWVRKLDAEIKGILSEGFL